MSTDLTQHRLSHSLCNEVLEGGHTHVCRYHELSEHEANNWKPAAHIWRAPGIPEYNHKVEQQCPQHRKR